MSTISTTISHNIYYGPGEAYLSPLTVTNHGAVLATAAGKAGVEGFGGGTLQNYGTIIASGSGDTGVNIDGSGGTVFNAGLLRGYARGLYVQGSGAVTNTGSILATGAGAQAAVEVNGAVSLTNDGTIVNSAGTGDGVQINAAGGTVFNGGLIQGYSEGLGMNQAGVVLNTGTIRSTGSGLGVAAVFQGSGGGTLTNHGTIITSAFGGNGVLLEFAGGTVVNSGLIQAYDFGVEMEAAGFVSNTGTVLSTGGNGRAAVVLDGGGTLVNTSSIVATGFDQLGVEATGGTVINSGFIEGSFTGLQMGGTGVLINSGSIWGASSPFFAYQADVEIYAGSFTNTSAGVVNRGVFVASGSSTNLDATVANAGTIVGGVGLNLNSDAPQGFPVPTYYGSGTVFLSGTVEGSSNDPFPIQFGGTNALLVLQHGYHIVGEVLGIGTAHPHTVELLGSAAAPVTVNFDPASFSNFGTVAFASGSGNVGTLSLAGSVDAPGTISGFTGAGDVIDVQFISDINHDAAAVLDPGNGQLTVTGDNGSVVLQLDPGETYSGFHTTPDGAGTDVRVGLICFCRGTRILTDRGEVAVEALKVGDRVRLIDGGSEPIVWIGEGRVLAARGRRSAATPVTVRKGALADNVPNQDLRITKGHSLYIDGALIPVEYLVNHRSIHWDDRAQEVSIYHIELATHGVLLANGAPSESYRDDGNRWLFQNANTGWGQAPKPPCAPVLTGGAVVDAVWRRLLDRAGPRGQLPLTDDPDLHLLVGGRRLEPVRPARGVCVFSLDGGPETVCAEPVHFRNGHAGQARPGNGRPETVRIVSNAAIPQELGLARDPRCLGVALRRIVVRSGTRFRIVEADDARLRDGFHPFEADSGLRSGFRWTNGDAALPKEVFDGFEGPVEVVLTVAATGVYLDEGGRRLTA